ncbi:GNAT family N-acetyltransferase [Adhaeribacter terreus]|uniref:GNAT family N-acetyltransferase n=1 Tax=Adhaeribacter terreus TaxID=529703 RepID=A0ABW0E4C8_9BACT
MYPVYERPPYFIYTDPEKADAIAIHQYLSQDSYWAEKIPLETVEKSLQNSLCFSVYANEKQIGLARVITDKATFAYLCDVYILEAFRGKGLSKWLMECVQSHPDIQGIRRFMLATKDAHGLYEQFGFKLSEAGRLMEIVNREVYN